MQLLHDRDIQSLLRNQQLNVAPAPGGGNGCVQQRLGKKTARESKGLGGWFVGAFSALNSGQALSSQAGQTDRPEDKPPARGFFDCNFGFQDCGIFFQRSAQRGVKSERTNS
ncbi:MAG TPA: hypothetical protein VGI42_04460 [Chthoniobacterales bacterium]